MDRWSCLSNECSDNWKLCGSDGREKAMNLNWIWEQIFQLPTATFGRNHATNSIRISEDASATMLTIVSIKSICNQYFNIARFHKRWNSEIHFHWTLLCSEMRATASIHSFLVSCYCGLIKNAPPPTATAHGTVANAFHFNRHTPNRQYKYTQSNWMKLTLFCQI